MNKILFTLLTVILVFSVFPAMAQVGKYLEKEITRTVYLDSNKNGKLDNWEKGIPGVAVSNGKEVVITGLKGKYNLPAYDEMVVMITKPAGYQTPLNSNNTPQFSYIHSPKGSPSEIKKYKGMEPTGDLPKEINFPLHKGITRQNFRAIVIGDTQPYDNNEVSFVRDTVVKEVSQDKQADFVLTLGDNIGDYLNLYPRFLKVMSELDIPVYLVPGNHDMNYDATTPNNSFDTFKNEFGPTYYSFDYGQAHFVVLNSVVYPSELYSIEKSKTYHGEICAIQSVLLLSYEAVVELRIPQDLHAPISLRQAQDRLSAQGDSLF